MKFAWTNQAVAIAISLIAIATAWFVQANFTPFDYAFDNYVVWLLAGIVAGAAAVTLGRGATPAKAAPLPRPPPPALAIR